jgi:AraC-like DNA-binding protein
VRDSARGVPAVTLRGLVGAYDGYRLRGGAPARHLGLPSPFMTVILTLDEPVEVVCHVDRRLPAGRYDALVGGLHSTPVVIGHDGAQSGVQLRISPLASRALFGMPAGELAGVDVPAEQVLGGLAEELRERVASAGGWRERFAVLDACLGRRLDRPVGVSPAVAGAWGLIVAGGGTVPVAAIAREVGFSERHLVNRFREEIGFTPKRASRVARFDRARRQLQARQIAGDRPDIARAAACCGYSDQSHLVRDFRAFAGLSPSQWLGEEFGNVQDAGRAEHLSCDP